MTPGSIDPFKLPTGAGPIDPGNAFFSFPEVPPGDPLNPPAPGKSVPGRSEPTGAGARPDVFELEPAKVVKKIDHRGHIIECKMESGVLVKIRDHGHVKKHAERAIFRAMMEVVRTEPYTPEELSKMTHIEAAAKNLARRGALGDGSDIERLLDRVMGKPKQSSETVSLNLTLDDILTASDRTSEEPEVIELEGEPYAE